MFGEPLFREAILRQSRGAMSSMMYQKADKLLIAEDIPKKTITNKSKLLKGNYSYWNQPIRVFITASLLLSG